jgi:hypothetical protein
MTLKVVPSHGYTECPTQLVRRPSSANQSHDGARKRLNAPLSARQKPIEDSAAREAVGKARHDRFAVADGVAHLLRPPLHGNEMWIATAL